MPSPAIAPARPANCTQPSTIARTTPKRKSLLDSLSPSAGYCSEQPLPPKLRPSASSVTTRKRLPPDDHANGKLGRTAFARSDPRTHARYHLELGKELMAHGFTSEAEAEFRHAAAVDPSSAAPLTALAEDYDARGDAREARAEAEAALRIRESADAYLILARLDLKRK
jgi:tetratricopeptide (TPR) repeat protein